MIPQIKSLLESTPRPIGVFLSKIPFRMRPKIGRPYSLYLNSINSFDRMDIKKRKDYILKLVKDSLASTMQIPFYRKLYASHEVRLNDIQTLEDISRLPIVSKEMLKPVPLEQRSFNLRGRYVSNTGGSSGSPLSFYITPGLIPKEWAHMHTIWDKLGYDQSMLKMTFGGRNLGKKNIAYDGLRHQISVNVYKGLENILTELRDYLNREKIFYLHGYPSALAEFAVNCKRDAPDIVAVLQKTLKGAFLGSEYPAPIYREQIESTFNIPTVSWYGHTERAILAWEKAEKCVYYPFQTYGFCEVIPNAETGGWRLIGTSYGNYASPFIRYDTEDDVEPVEMQDGLLISFRIRSGRLGEFVIDRQGLKIPLTALIFGRHHRIFDIAQFIQVSQDEAGVVTILITPKGDIPSLFVFDDWFDRTGVDIKIKFEIVEKPVRTESGKITLKVN